MNYKGKFKAVRIIDVQDFNDIVEKIYGIPYNYQQQDGCKSRGCVAIDVDDLDLIDYSNTTIPEVVNGDEMGVQFEAWKSRDPNKPLSGVPEDEYESYMLELFYHRNFYPSLDIVVDDLIKRDIIPNESFYIDIDW